MANSNTYRFPFAAYPAIRLTLLFAGGIVLDFFFTPSKEVWLFLLTSFITVHLIIEFFLIRNLRSSLYSIVIFSYLGMMLSFGGFWHALLAKPNPPAEGEILNSFEWQEFTFHGTIWDIRQSESGKFHIDMQVDSTAFPDSFYFDAKYNLRALLDPDKVTPHENIAIGNRITFSGIIYPLEEVRNPSQFDYKQFLASKRVYLQVGINRIDEIKPQTNKLSWLYLRKEVLQRIEHNFSPETASLAKALLIGYKNELHQKEKLNFSRAGLSHIMAVSGLHVGFILAPFWIIIPFFWSFRFGKEVGLLLLIALLVFYAGLTGFSASVMRASLVGGFLAYGKLFHKVRDSKNLTAAAAFVILIADPSQLFAIGFQLSFSAVFVILMLIPPISRILPGWIQYRWYGTPVMIVIVSIIVQIGLFPILTYYFGEFSLIGPLANAFVVPFLGFAVPYALFLLIFSTFIPQIAIFLNTPADYLLNVISKFVELAANLPSSWISYRPDSASIFVFWIVLVFLVASLHIPKYRWKLISALVSVLIFQQGMALSKKMNAPQLTVTIFDVGQGDAALVETPDNKHFLIDAGRWQPGYNSAKQIIIPHLNNNNIKKLDGIFLSHPHADHIGGILDLIEHIPVDTIYNSGASHDSNLYTNYIASAAVKNIPVTPLSFGDIKHLDSSVRLLVYAPYPNTVNSNVNNSSLVFEIIYGETEFLFTGDIESRQETELATRYPDFIDTDFLKAAHHGSKTSSTDLLLQKTSPEISSVSLGMRNRFGHPHQSAVQRLRKYSDQVLFTSLDGAIILESDGRHISRKIWRR